MLRADVALAVAKEHGGSWIEVFDEATYARLQQRHVRLVELADAIANDEFALVYQPTFDLATRRITGAEALIRWDHPLSGRLLPDEFITLAEGSELIVPLSRWVLDRLLRDLAAGPVLPANFRIYFNLSSRTLSDLPFIAEVREVLDRFPDLVEHIGVEVTERAAIDNVQNAMRTLESLRAWGLTVAIDDFGTGYSSLSYLKQLAADVIKIDRSFVTPLPGSGSDGVITDMLLRMADSFGFTTLAEGVETEEQAAWLLAHGCQRGQGYLVAKGGSFDELLQRLVTSSPPHKPRQLRTKRAA
jgi:EAL domain-containing protein (putative c-di-GMP-specific phosphodiesterase class I)